MHSDSENSAHRCMECGGTDELQELLQYQIDGDQGTVTSHWMCLSCLIAGELRDAEETAAFWEAQLAASGPDLHREQARAHCATVAVSMRQHLAAFGVSPGERAAAFIARYADHR
jgi:hypothetical protein